MQFWQIQKPFCKDYYLPELYFRIRRFILLVQTKKVISMNYGGSKSRWKPWRWVRLDLIFSMRDIDINSNLNPLWKFTSSSSSRSTKFKDILPWNISQMIMKTVSISMRIVISYAMKRDIPLWIWWNVNGKWDNKMIRISQWGKQLQFPVANTLFSFNEKQICYEYIVAFMFFPFFGMKIDLKLAMQLSLDCM